MTKRVLTEAAIKRFPLPKGNKQVEHFDAALPGFALRVTPKGTKSFTFFYRVNGKLRRSTLGRFPFISLAEARDKARDILRQLDEGKDPRHAKEAQKAGTETTQAYTYKVAVNDFIEKYAIAKKKSRRWKDQKALLINAGKKLDATGRPDKDDRGWADLPITEITRKHIHDTLDVRMAAGSPYVANRTYEVLCTLYRWLYSRDIVPENLMDKVLKPFDGEKPRERVWSDEEIKALWETADKLDELWPAYLKLVIVMGQRKSEISGMRWDGLDLDMGVWKLPEDEHKSKRGHKFPLPPLAVRILKGVPKVKDSPYVFPGRSGGPMHVGSAAQNRIKKLSGVEDFTYHDARRTLRTGLDKLRIPPHVKNECLGHARQGVGDVHYSHYDYLDEQREAFELWAAHIEMLLDPSVVSLHG